jgi:Protein kinase domain/WD40-like Beta Propeller Repeat
MGDDASTLIAAALDDRYVIERQLGAGGMAVVYLARDRKLDRDVALKVLRPELGAVLGAERFLTEIKISARLDHPHILTLIDSGEANGLLYYVLPFVRGESLRDKLNREHQLGIEEALTITKQVASALDYAHRQQLVHRDIKPENILLQEGEAMLADFGIALAVKEAGGNRLTQTGLSLGTPQYMSPEQATGDRGIDARSDVYSLAAVLYEMLAGEPPVTGASAQSMIAKLMTETPTHLRVLRSTVPPEIDAAVARALAKTPADRFTSAGEFARALAVHHSTQQLAATAPASAPVSRRSRRPLALTLGGIVLAAAALGVYAMRAKPAGPASLGAKTQLTSTGSVLYPAISPDGKQLAFLTRQCTGADCTYATMVQDVGGTTTRTILDSATAGYGLEWSPDRRNLMYSGTVRGRSGTFLLSALGGEPRWLTSGVASFYAGGDSLLLGPSHHSDSVYYVRVAALDGIPRDSIRIAGPGNRLNAISVVPGTSWILTLVIQPPRGLWQIVDRSGKLADRVVNACTCGGIAATDAVWLARAGDGLEESVVRIAIDRSNGRFAARQDTMAHGVFTAFSLTGDGAKMVMDEGTFEHSVWALPVADAVKGAFPDERRIARASTDVAATISPDGARLLMRRVVPTSGRSETRWSVMPFDGGAETPLPAQGVIRRAKWSDAQHVATSMHTPSGLRLSDIDVRSGAVRSTIQLPDSVVADWAPMPNGWAWIPVTRDRIVVSEGGRRREYRPPAWFAGIYQLSADRANRRIFYLGFGRATGDSAGVAALTLDDGKSTLWATHFAEDARVMAASAHQAVFAVATTQDSWSLFGLDGPGAMKPLGTIGRPIFGLSVSEDLGRSAIMVLDYRADAWMNQVVVR